MGSILKLLNHTTIDDRMGHVYDIYWVQQGTAGSGNHNELPLDTTKQWADVATAACLTDGTQTTPTVTLFYGGGNLRLTSGTAGDKVAVITRRDVGNPAAGSTQVYPSRFS